MFRCVPLLLALLLTALAEASADLRLETEMTTAPGNIAITPDGRTFVSIHQFFKPSLKVAEVTGTSDSLRAFPDQRDVKESSAITPDTVLGLHADSSGTVWMLDNAMPGGTTPTLYAITSTGSTHRYPLVPPATVAGSFVNDVAVDLPRRRAYIADPASGSGIEAALIVINLDTGVARRVLQGHPSVIPEPDVELRAHGSALEATAPTGQKVRPKVGVNPIALSTDGKWLYYGPMTGHAMYRMNAAVLADESASSATLRAGIKRHSYKPVCDGMTIDAGGNLYLGDLERNAVGFISPAGKYTELVAGPALAWPNAFAVAPDGRIHFVCNQLQLAPPFQNGQDKTRKPFQIFSIAPVLTAAPSK